MGNNSGKCKCHSLDVELYGGVHCQKTPVKFLNDSNECMVDTSDPSLSSQWQYSTLWSRNSSSLFTNFSCPWSRTFKSKFNKKMLGCPLSLSKTTWPIPLYQSLFLPEFKIRDIVCEESFSIIGIVSSGGFSNVYKVVKKDTNETFAMKILSKSQLVANNLIAQVKEEVNIQKAIDHYPFVVHSPYHWQSKKQLFIISEYISGGELYKLLQEKGSLPMELIKFYIAELAMALEFLHNAGIIYRDLKLENVLLNMKGHIQLIDFGLSKWLKYGSRTNTICGTMQYIAPEILQQKSYGHAADWWSLGIILICMATGGDCPIPSCSFQPNLKEAKFPKFERMFRTISKIPEIIKTQFMYCSSGSK